FVSLDAPTPPLAPPPLHAALPIHLLDLRPPGPDATRRALAEAPAGSLVVNASGLGKDRPGSPLPDDAVLPEGAFAWEFNYRGSRSEEHTSELQSRENLVCRLLLEE